MLAGFRHFGVTDVTNGAIEALFADKTGRKCLEPATFIGRVVWSPPNVRIKGISEGGA